MASPSQSTHMEETSDQTCEWPMHYEDYDLIVRTQGVEHVVGRKRVVPGDPGFQVVDDVRRCLKVAKTSNPDLEIKVEKMSEEMEAMKRGITELEDEKAWWLWWWINQWMET